MVPTGSEADEPPYPYPMLDVEFDSLAYKAPNLTAWVVE